MRKNLYYITIVSICILTFWSCKKQESTSLVENNKEITQQQKIPHASQLTEKLIKHLTEEIPIKDTLFIATHRLYSICGNEYDDPDYKKREEEARLNYIKENPYFVDYENDYKSYYRHDDKTIAVGVAFEDEIEVDGHEYPTKHKLILDLNYLQVTPDTVIAVAQDASIYKSDMIEFTMARQDTIWSLANVGKVKAP